MSQYAPTVSTEREIFDPQTVFAIAGDTICFQMAPLLPFLSDVIGMKNERIANSEYYGKR